MKTYQVTQRGLEQIKQWLLAKCGYDAGDDDDLARAIHFYAEAAARAEDGQIKLPASATVSGRHAYLRPERAETTTKTYPPEFLQRLIADHEAEQAGATTEDSSAVQAKGDAMSEIERFTRHDSGDMLRNKDGGWVRYQDHRARVRRLATELAEAHELCSALQLAAEQADEMKAHAEASVAAEAAETDRVTAERDAAQVEVERLRAEVERLQANGQAMLDTSRATDEDIWREAFITMLPSFPWEKAAEKSDCVLVEYRKRWPR